MGCDILNGYASPADRAADTALLPVLRERPSAERRLEPARALEDRASSSFDAAPGLYPRTAARR